MRPYRTRDQQCNCKKWPKLAILKLFVLKQKLWHRKSSVLIHASGETEIAAFSTIITRILLLLLVL
jgi:hypothetical protein